MPWIARRCLISLGLLFVVATVIFSILYIVPGDPAEMMLSAGGVAPDPESVAAMRAQLGLDRSFLEQYGDFLSRLIRFDLGTSFADGSSVAAEIGRRLPRTLELIAVATAIALAIGIPLGTLAAERRGRADRWLTTGSGIALSAPVFVIGTLLTLVFAQMLGWVKAGSYVAFNDSPLGHIQALTLPAITIAIGLTAVVFRMVRTTALETMNREWVRTARAKGLTRSEVMERHVLRNALGPVMTVVGLQMGHLLGGTVLVEYVFNWPGLSSLLVQAVEQRDYPVVQGVVLIISMLFVVLNLLVDILYGVLDPRVRQQ